MVSFVIQTNEVCINILGDTTSYVRDDELGRQTLAGMNPISIEKLKVSKRNKKDFLTVSRDDT